jgi:hypothetical protein
LLVSNSYARCVASYYVCFLAVIVSKANMLEGRVRSLFVKVIIGDVGEVC